MGIPSIFELLDRVAFLRGTPAVTIVVITAVLITLFWDWRLALLALTVQYLAAGLLFVDVLDPRLAIVKVIVGLFVCLILLVTGLQIRYGKLPPDVTPAEAAQLRNQRYVTLRGLKLPANALLRLAATLVLMLIVLFVAQRLDFSLPGIPPDAGHLTLPILTLIGLGLLGVALSRHPFPAGMSLFTFLTGFELYYSVLDTAVATLAILAGLNLALAIAVALLAQIRQARLVAQLT